MTEEVWERPTNNSFLPAFRDADALVLAREIEKFNPKTVLEFGPGDSTQALINMGLEVTTCENIDKWLEVAKERFGDTARVLKFHDEFPVTVDGLGADEQFDFAFVDAPAGHRQVRKVHPGYEDCSRLNTVLFALSRAPVVLLDDGMRPLERGSLGRLNALGHKVELLVNSFGRASNARGGMARITRRVEEQNRPDPPCIAELGNTSPRPKPKQRRKAVDGRSNRRDASGAAREGCGLHSGLGSD